MTVLRLIYTQRENWKEKGTEQNGEPLVWNKKAQFKMDINDGSG